MKIKSFHGDTNIVLLTFHSPASRLPACPVRGEFHFLPGEPVQNHAVQEGQKICQHKYMCFQNTGVNQVGYIISQPCESNLIDHDLMNYVTRKIFSSV